MKIAFVTNGVPRLNSSGASDICYTLAKEFKIKILRFFPASLDKRNCLIEISR